MLKKYLIRTFNLILHKCPRVWFKSVDIQNNDLWPILSPRTWMYFLVTILNVIYSDSVKKVVFPFVNLVRFHWCIFPAYSNSQLTFKCWFFFWVIKKILFTSSILLIGVCLSPCYDIPLGLCYCTCPFTIKMEHGA